MGNRPKIGSVVFETTSRCNLNCQYCYNIHKMPGGPKGLRGSYGRAKKTLSRLFSVANVDRITMSGGEPFLMDRFLELVLFCRMKGKRVLIISNGTAGTRDEYKNLIDIGVTTFELPLHSPEPGEHDEMTATSGSWKKVRRSIETITELGGTVVPMIVLTKINHARVADTLQLFKGLGLRRVMINRFNIGGRGIARAAQLSLTTAELRDAFARAHSMTVKCGLSVTSNVCTPVCILKPEDYPRIGFAACTPDLSRRPLTMDTLGNLRYCNHSPHSMGNIFNEKMEAIFSSPYAKSWERSVPRVCTDCERWKQCFGGCRAAAEQLGQTVSEVDPLLTQHLLAS